MRSFSSKCFWTFVPPVLATIAFVTSCLANFWCETIQFEPIATGDGGGGSTNNYVTMQFGPWYQKDVVMVMDSNDANATIKYATSRNVCIPFPSDTYIDPKLMATRAFSVISLILGGISLGILWIVALFYRHEVHDSKYCKYFGEFITKGLTLCQGLTFFLLDSGFCFDNPILSNLGWSDLYVTDCQWDRGTTCNVISTVMWFLTGIIMTEEYKGRHCPDRDDEVDIDVDNDGNKNNNNAHYDANKSIPTSASVSPDGCDISTIAYEVDGSLAPPMPSNGGGNNNNDNNNDNQYDSV